MSPEQKKEVLDKMETILVQVVPNTCKFLTRKPVWDKKVLDIKAALQGPRNDISAINQTFDKVNSILQSITLDSDTNFKQQNIIRQMKESLLNPEKIQTITPQKK